MATVQLKSTFHPMGDLEPGAQDMHYGYTFIVTPTEKKDAKGKTICILVADLPDDAALALLEADRVVEYKAPKKAEEARGQQ
jgi:hypothetical protein